MHPTPRRAARLGALLLVVATAAPAGHWAQFRGPNGTGDAGNAALPETFTKDHLIWKVPLPGSGHGSPVVWGDKLFLQTAPADGSTRDLVCLNALTGQKLWSQGVKGQKAPASGKIHPEGSLANSTPAVDAERVYTIFWDGDKLHAAAYTHDGKEVWKKDLGTYVNEHSFGGSPVVHDGRVFFNNDQGNQQKQGPASAMALDAKTGDTLWTAKRKGFRCCMSVPVVNDRADGKKEVVFASTAGVTGYDPATGKELWSYDWAFDGGKALRAIGVPVLAGGLVVANCGEGGAGRSCLAIKLNGSGDLGKSALAWEKKKETPYVPSLLAKGEHLFVLEDKLGLARCLEVATGKEVWSNKLSAAGFYASPVVVGDRVVAINRDGDIVGFKAGATFTPLGTYELGELVFATPAVANDRLYVRGDKHLFCLGKR